MTKYIFGLLLLSTLCQAQLKVAVLDTGLDLNDSRFKSHLCKSGHKNYTQEPMNDLLGHGTHVVGSIIKNAGKSDYCLVIYKVFEAEGHTNVFTTIKALEDIIKDKIDVVNYSAGGKTYVYEEDYLIKLCSRIRFIVAAGNDNSNVDGNYYPASLGYKNIIVVGNGKSEEEKSHTSNYGKKVNIWIPGDHILSTLPKGKTGYMSGTSMSASIETGRYIYEISHRSN